MWEVLSQSFVDLKLKEKALRLEKRIVYRFGNMRGLKKDITIVQ